MPLWGPFTTGGCSPNSLHEYFELRRSIITAGAVLAIDCTVFSGNKDN